jgi:PKD repeat protein
VETVKRGHSVFFLVFVVLVAALCSPVNAAPASPQSGIKNIAVTKLIDDATTKKTLFVITTEENTYHIIVDANITTVGTETLINLSATLYNPLNETITASARIPDTLTGAPFYNGPVEALRIHLDKPTVDALKFGLPIVTFVALFLEAVFIVTMIAVAPVLVALKLLLDDGFFIWASLPWVLLTLLQDATPDGIDLYFPVSPLNVLYNLIFDNEIYYIRTDSSNWWKISEHDVYVYIWIWRVELFDYYTAERVYVPTPIDPIARFVWTPNEPVVYEDVTFDGSLSYAPSGYITDYQWSLGDGGLATDMNFTHSYHNPGNYDVTLTVTDNNSKTNTTTHTVNVGPGGPVLRAVPDYLQVNVIAGQSATAEFYVGETLNQTDLLSVNFAAHDFSKTFDIQTIASGNVTFDKNGITVPKGTWTNVTVTFNAPPFSSMGWYSGNMTVTSANGGNSTIFADLFVSGPPTANFTWSPLIPKVGDVVTFDASSSILGGGSILTYAWDFGDGNKTTTTTAIVTHAFSNAATYLVTLNVTDSNGLWNTTQEQVQVVQPYGPKANFTVSPETANVGQLITFDATSSQSGWNGTNQMPITLYAWNFGDGQTANATTPTVTHAFSSSGIYYPSLTVHASGATPESDTITKRVLITASIVGGYSVSLASLKTITTALSSSFYLAIVAMLAVVFTAIRRKKRKD